MRVWQSLSISQLVSLRSIRRRSFFPPTSPARSTQREFRLIALALNGTVRAVTQPWSFAAKGKNGKWSALIDPQFLQPGKNTIEAFGVDVQQGQITLVRAAGSPEHLPVFEARASDMPMASPDETSEIIITPSGNRQSLTPSALDGWVDRAEIKAGHLELAGWAANVEQSQIAQEIWVYVNGEFFHTGRFRVARLDVAEYFGNPALGQSGFHYSVPLAQFRESSSLTLRLFAVSQEGHISELQYPARLRSDGFPPPTIRLHVPKTRDTVYEE